MDVPEFVFQHFSLSYSKSIFDKNMEYLTFIRIREEQGTMNLFKNFLSMANKKF